MKLYERNMLGIRLNFAQKTIYQTTINRITIIIETIVLVLYFILIVKFF